MRAYFEDSTEISSVKHLSANISIETDVPPVAVHEAHDRDPILIGDRFVLVPASRIVLPIDAAMAFGSGRHETTQLCLRALEQCVRPGQTVVDVGCGSGILALAALKLGAARVIASDISESAVVVARRHFPGPLFVGSADSLLDESADVVVANITGKVDDQIAFDLKRIARPGGLIIVSGFTTQTAPQNFRSTDTLTLDDWQCWICKRSDVTFAASTSGQNDHQQAWWL